MTRNVQEPQPFEVAWHNIDGLNIRYAKSGSECWGVIEERTGPDVLIDSRPPRSSPSRRHGNGAASRRADGRGDSRNLDEPLNSRPLTLLLGSTSCEIVQCGEPTSRSAKLGTQPVSREARHLAVLGASGSESSLRSHLPREFCDSWIRTGARRPDRGRRVSRGPQRLSPQRSAALTSSPRTMRASASFDPLLACTHFDSSYLTLMPPSSS